MYTRWLTTAVLLVALVITILWLPLLLESIVWGVRIPVGVRTALSRVGVHSGDPLAGAGKVLAVVAL